MLTMTEVN